MEKPGFKIRRRLFVAIGLMIAATGFWYFWTWYRTPPEQPHATAPRAFVKVGGQGQGSGDRLLSERAELLDPTPLFIPTDKNFGQGELPARVVRQPGQVFGNYDAKYNFEESGLINYGSATDTAPDSLPEVLNRGNEAPFAGLGQIDVPRAPLTVRVAQLEVKSLSSGEIVMTEPVTDLAIGRKDLVPVEFIVAVGNSGLLGEPVLTNSSGSDELDGILRDYLGRSYRLGERLPPGRYMVVVGP